jgi:hypothetical protein
MSEAANPSPVRRGRAAFGCLLLIFGDAYTAWLVARMQPPKPIAGIADNPATEREMPLRFKWRIRRLAR